MLKKLLQEFLHKYLIIYLSSALMQITLSVPMPRAAAPFLIEKWLYKVTKNTQKHKFVPDKGNATTYK